MRRIAIANNKNQSTFAKRLREQSKKRKADDKRAKRTQRKDTPADQRPEQPSDNPVVDGY